MIDVALARHAHQDLHKLLGVKRLSQSQKLIASLLALELMDAEASPREELLKALITPSANRPEPDD